MGLLTRMTTLFKADAHGVVDSIEDRSLLLKQHLREAESELVRKRARLEAVVAEEKQSREASKRLASEMKRLEEDVSLAIDGDKEELARFAIKKLLGLKRRSEQLERRGKQLREEVRRAGKGARSAGARALRAARPGQSVSRESPRCGAAILRFWMVYTARVGVGEVIKQG